MTPFSIYVVEDEDSIRKSFYYQLKKFYHVEEFADAEKALFRIAEDPPDLVLLDIGLPGMNGIDALKEIKTIIPTVLVIMTTAKDDITTVVSAMKIGAYDYLLKPVDADTLSNSVKNALATIKMHKELRELQQKYLCENMPCFIAESDSIQEIMSVVKKVAGSHVSILIVGESGTGKELIANCIHYNSPNFRGSFIGLNCAAIPENLIESELFGYEKGAFSGASSTGKKGQIELAADGTLFLDEVGDLNLESQAKLLRFLEQGEFYRVGGIKKIQVDTRIISATNKDLEKMIEQGSFREDLYFRLAVFKLEIPSLNDRREDILLIAKSYLAQFAEKYHKNFTEISSEVVEFFMTHHWKGNIRELKNTIERGAILGVGPILEFSDLGLGKTTKVPAKSPVNFSTKFPPLPDQGIDLAALEEHFLREAIRKADGNDSKAAKLLGLSYYTFRYRKKSLADKNK